MGDTLIHEPQRQLLGQLPHRKLLGAAESCMRTRSTLRYPRASQAGHHELDGLLQLAQIAFELGLSQPDAIPATLVQGTVQKGRVSRRLRTPLNRGNITVGVPSISSIRRSTRLVPLLNQTSLVIRERARIAKRHLAQLNDLLVNLLRM